MASCKGKVPGNACVAHVDASGGPPPRFFYLTTITFTITTTIITMAVIETSCLVPLRLEAMDEMRRCLSTHGPGADVSHR